MWTIVAVVALAVGGIALAHSVGKTPTVASPMTPVTPHGAGAQLPSTPTTAAPVPSTTPTTVAPAPSTSPPSATPLVTLAVAQQVMATTWKSFAVALAEGDRATMSTLATPGAMDVVSGAFDCGCPPWPTAYAQVSFTAPPETQYPLSFFAEMQGTGYDGSPQTREAEFTQASPTAPWLVTYLGYFDTGVPLLGATPTDTLVAPPPGPAAQARQAPGQLTAFIQALDAGQTTTPPSDFLDSGWLSQIITGTESWNAELAGNHWTRTTNHTVGPVSTVFASDNGGAFLCYEMDNLEVYHGSPGYPLVQSADQNEWGSALPPGQYSVVNQEATYDICLSANPDGKIGMMTNWGGFYVTTGTPS